MGSKVPMWVCVYDFEDIRTSHNPRWRFWKCPNLHGERGCGLLIWMDEVATEYAPGRNIGHVQIESREDETRTSLEEMKQEIKHEIKLLRESVGAHNFQQQQPNYCSYILMMFLIFVAYAFGSNFAT